MLCICLYEKPFRAFILSIRKVRFIGLSRFSLESIASQVAGIQAEEGHKSTAT